ncbi:proto-oncogene tyrosine-protein kinase receptor Ret-like [Stegodyphus dumicola]|uniref:proto-oncogene tyrosine-protein kinase receptor Ret-like n=1 Tax=Stegodyphus dumicola TaxID=202533 RepID=UPI0015B28AE0|nr:proto-oncogene tyrosine-protein kinase receptor Ret-like [Stegodyphus dumicola]
MLQDVDVSQIIPGEPLPTQLTVLDADSASVNVIVVNMSDPLGLFHLRDPVIFHGINGTQMLINTALVPKMPFHFPDPSYNVTVTFEDTSLIGDVEARPLTFYVRILNRSQHVHHPSRPADFRVYASIFRHSSHHARVVQPMEVKPHDGYFFRLSGEPEEGLPSTRIFGVTPVTGIVYIRDEVSLARSPANFFKLQLSWRSKDKTDRSCNIFLTVLDAGDPRTVCGLEPGHHFQSCALHANAETCFSSCGRGALDGFCRWRSQSSATLISEYATCSPHLETCPDGVCDELEMMDPFICPQDCASNVRGEAVPAPSGKGVGKSAAPCTCVSPNTCVCVNFSPPPKRVRPPASRSRVKSVEEPHTLPPLPMEYQDNEWTQCGAVCSSMIAVVSLIICGLVATAGFLICRHRLGKNKDQEFPNVTTPLNSLNQHTDRAAQDSVEFPRDRLSLGETLGEGEFGRVVKGKAKNIAGIPGVTTVAVKMLKENSSEAERKDLITEMNFLKEISHPNVVRLLGACTDDAGPLYVIVEYAEHGSLITYLRKMRARYPEVRGDMKELLSFAWQIAKGMDYLAEMKVVHRDLAARNVLVATGKVMKISDFGLSRDVYEGDTYLKATRGRVPVKWMALESLQSQLYTTKSDVWSYGILLWEIVTLGGCPYPGIPSERLYQLLKEGYRMPRPDDCPSQLYKIMTSCWKENPNERPHFKELVQKLDNLLNDSTHYLPLTDDNCQPFCKRPRGRAEEASLMQQLTFPKMSVVQIGPYENRHLLSPTEFNV